MESTFSTTLPLVVYHRAAGEKDWQELDRGPGYFHIPEGEECMVRARNIGNRELETLVNDVCNCPAVISLNLSENRKITDAGMAMLPRLPKLRELNIGACDITNEGMVFLKSLSHLTHLNLSFCNRISDEGLRPLKTLNHLIYLDAQGCVRLTHSGLVRHLNKRVEINL